MLDPASITAGVTAITAGVTALTSAVGAALGSVTVNATLSAIGGGLAGNTAMEFAKGACRKAADSVGLLRHHLTRLDPRENHILLRAMVMAYWQSIAQVAEQHRLTRSDGGGPLLDLIDRCDARSELAKTANPATLSKDEWESAIEGAYTDLTALVAQDMKDPASASAREGPAKLAWKALRAEFPEAADMAFERSFFENWFYAFTVNFQFAATTDPQVRDLLLLHLFSEIPSREPEAILNAFEQLGDAIRTELAGVHTAIDAMHTDIGHQIAEGTHKILSSISGGIAAAARPAPLTTETILLDVNPNKRIFAREDEAALLRRTFARDDVRIVSIVAPPGFGKSSVFLLAARRIGEESPPTGDSRSGGLTGIVLLDLRRKDNQDFLASLADRVQRITRVEPPSLGILPEGEKSVAFLKYLASAGSFWLALDNAEEFLDSRRPEFLVFLKEFCRLGHSSRIVLLSRSAWAAAQNPPLHVTLAEIRDALREGIPEEDAMALFRQCFSSGEGSRFALLADPLVRGIVTRLHRMPMAIEQFAGYLNARAAEFPEGNRFEREIRNSNLLRLFNPENPEAFLLGVIRAHVEHLSAREQSLLTLVAWAGMPVPHSGLSAVDRAFHADAATSVLTQLANSGLLERTAGTAAEGIAFGMHAIVREAIGGHALPDLETVVSALMEAGYAEATAREYRPALTLFTLSERGTRRLVEEEDRRELEDDLAMALMNRGTALGSLQRLPEAVTDYDAAIAILRRLVEEENRRELENGLAMALMNRGNALRRLQRLPEAVTDCDAAIAIRRRLVEEENHRELENDLASALVYRGNALQSLQRLPEAVTDYDEAIAILRRLVEEENHRELENDLASALMNRGIALGSLQRLPEAVTDYDAAIAIRRRLVEEENHRELENDLAMACYNAAFAFDRLDDHGRACDLAREALRLWKELVDAGMDQIQDDLADARALVTHLGCLK